MDNKFEKQSYKVILKIIVKICLIIILISFFHYLLADPGMKYYYFEKYEKMLNVPGLIPEGFPVSASNIHAQFSHDSGLKWILFNASSSDIVKFEESFEQFNFKNYSGGKLLKPGSWFWSIDTDLLIDTYKRASKINNKNEYLAKVKDEFKKNYTFEQKEYVNKVGVKKNTLTIYYWTSWSAQGTEPTK